MSSHSALLGECFKVFDAPCTHATVRDDAGRLHFLDADEHPIEAEPLCASGCTSATFFNADNVRQVVVDLESGSFSLIEDFSSMVVSGPAKLDGVAAWLNEKSPDTF